MNIDQFLAQLSSYHSLKVIGPMPLTVPVIVDGPVIYVDGGINHMPQSTHLKISIGDNDSNKTNLNLDITLPQEKDYSDLTYVLGLIPSHITRLELYGFLGGRLDHQMVALGSIYHFLKGKKQETHCRLENHIIAISHGKVSFEHEGIFSVISFEKQTIKIEGKCRYKITTPKQIGPMSCQGLSNVAFGEVAISASAPLFIIKSSN